MTAHDRLCSESLVKLALHVEDARDESCHRFFRIPMHREDELLHDDIGLVVEVRLQAGKDLLHDGFPCTFCHQYFFRNSVSCCFDPRTMLE